MRKTTTTLDTFTGETRVQCSIGHTLQAEFRCFTADGADMIAHTFVHVGTDAARAVYATLYADKLQSLDCDAPTVH